MIMVGPDPDFSGGIETVIRNFKSLSSDDLEIDNLVSWRPNSFFGLLPFLKSIICIIRLRKRRNFVLFHFHFGHGGSFLRESTLAWVARLIGFRAIATMHGHNFSELTNPIWKNTLKRFVFPALDMIFVLSPKALHLIESMGRIPILTPNPLMSEPNLVNYSERDDYLFFAGRIEKRKGLDLLIQVWPKVASLYPHLRLYIAGPEGDVSIAEFSKLLNVEYLGVLKPVEVSNFSSHALAVVLPSRNEQSPLLLWEAMASGTNIVASRAGGISWMLGENYPFLMDSIDEGSLLAKILDLMQSRDDLESAGNILHNRAKQASPTVFLSKYKEYISVFEKEQG